MSPEAKPEALTLTPHRVMSLEQSVEYIAPDELVEITPTSLRLRKKILNALDRKRTARNERYEEAMLEQED